ncbi:MAG: hypothetical protein HYZ30_00545 [Candidatus Azosocius agrarius]|nr:MAG: hypothetical protein HYZ30_00545 [Gammaproteobacteria bacterium]
MNPHLNTAINMIRKFGKNVVIAFDQLCIKKLLDREADLYIKFVKDKCISEIQVIINKLYPNHKIISNYEDLIDYNTFSWIINIIDNEINFKKGIQEISLSISVLYKDCVNDSVIYNPFENNLFIASKNGGAKLNGKRIKVLNNSCLKNSLINVNFFDITNYIHYCKYIRLLLSEGVILRSNMSLSSSLTYVASGIYDGYINFNILKNEYNSIFASKLLIYEAGGYISDFTGEDLMYNNVLCAGPKLYIKLLQLFNNVIKK